MTTTATSTERHRPDCPDPRPNRLAEFIGGRGDLVVRCRACRATTVLQPEPEPDAASRPESETRRRWLGCYRCGCDMWPASSKPRIPLCDTCKGRE